MKRLIAFIVLFCIVSIFAETIDVISKNDKMAIYNQNTRKIYTYYLLAPEQEISLKVNGVENLSILTRVLLQKVEKTFYDYQLTIGKEVERIRKSANPSKVTRGISGEDISAYNKTTVFLDYQSKIIKVRNISKNTLLIKFNTDTPSQSNNSIEYVSFTPDVYNEEAILLVDDKEYTYFTLGDGGIQFTLEGPVVLKILSRYLFESTFINTNNYRFKIYDNDKLHQDITQQAFKSAKALMQKDQSKIPSTAKVNILKFDEGLHTIKIMNGAINRELIFNFYISKSAIEIGEE